MTTQQFRRIFGVLFLSAVSVVGLSGREDDVPLIEAVKAADQARVQSLLAQSVDPNGAETDGTTALHWAVLREDLALVQQLLDAGARVEASNRYGVSPLMIASTNGSAPLIRVLIAAGADSNTSSPGGETVLMSAARNGARDAVEVLLGAGATVDATEGWRGQTALMWAAVEDNALAAEALLAAGADVHARSTRGFTPLLFAVREGNLDTVETLLARGDNPDDTLPAQPRPAAMTEETEDAEAEPEGTSALILSTINAHYDVTAALLEAGANPNDASPGWTALHQVTWTRRPNLGRNPPFPVPSGLLDGLEVTRLLVEYGADPNARQQAEPRDGNRNMLNRIGATPFLLAAKVADVEMMRLLVELGADPMLTTDEGATSLMAAAGVGIWKIGENPGTNAEAFEAVQLAWELGNDVNAADSQGDTALHGAIHRGSGETVQFLVDKGAHLDPVNDTGWTPLSIAQGVFYPNTFNRHPDLVALLEELGADPSAGARRQLDLAPWERQALEKSAPQQ